MITVAVSGQNVATAKTTKYKLVVVKGDEASGSCCPCIFNSIDEDGDDCCMLKEKCECGHAEHYKLEKTND